jgi:AcrR family transcriptional regulator
VRRRLAHGCASVNIECTIMSGESSSKRKYELKQRAQEMAETRRRITEAAVELHGTVGPARTTMSAVAERAGVQRHTLYRHFPNESKLFGACSAHFFAANPLPDPTAWRAIGDPRQRLARALDDLYAYYERTEPMFSKVLRDVELVEAVGPSLAPMQDYLAEAIEVLAVGWQARGRRRRVLAAALRHALNFHVWRSLATDATVSRAEAVELVGALVDAAAAAAPQHRAAA